MAEENSGKTSFWVSFGGHEVQLPVGETLIGRSDACQIVLEDALVSRRHALLCNTGDAVEITDLGSVNGVLVNGERISGSSPIRVGSRITLGRAEISLKSNRSERATLTRESTQAVTLTAQVSEFPVPVEEPPPDTGEREATRRGDLLHMLGGVADKVLSMGRGEEAERVMSNLLHRTLVRARQGRRIEGIFMDRVAMYAARIAEATKKSGWVNYVVELYHVQSRVMPTDVVDKLYVAVRGVSGVDVQLIANYVDRLKEREAELGPSDRFLLRRLDGLSELARHSSQPQSRG